MAVRAGSVSMPRCLQVPRFPATSGRGCTTTGIRGGAQEPTAQTPAEQG